MKHLKIYLMLLGFSIFTGATFNLAKYTVDYFSPASAAAWRFGIASVIMLIILLYTEGIKKNVLKQNVLIYIFLGMVGIFGFNTLFFVGLKYTSPVNGALIMGLNPLLTTILSRIILKDKISKKQLAGILFAFIGVLIVITQGYIETIKNLSISVGDLFILAGNTCWALYGVLGRRYIKDVSPLSTTTYTMIVGAVCLIIVSLTTQNPVPIHNIPIQTWGAIAFMAIFTSVLGYLWWNQGIKVIGASNTSIFFNLVPIVTMIISYVTGSQITFIQISGAILVIFGVLLSSGIIKHQIINIKKHLIT
ncbi:DMT family transporter [Bacillus massiliigorillae]|uniref:DMT family transporter n=1 Tax=Bacillus massiliigorillae TaxID=1243664 RepID=UPI0003A9EF34|nr:EamA family transporter [Bacillus massiliigorillae]